MTRAPYWASGIGHTTPRLPLRRLDTATKEALTLPDMLVGVTRAHVPITGNWYRRVIGKWYILLNRQVVTSPNTPSQLVARVLTQVSWSVLEVTVVEDQHLDLGPQIGFHLHHLELEGSERETNLEG